MNGNKILTRNGMPLEESDYKQFMEVDNDNFSHEPILPWTDQEKRQFLFAIIGVAAAFLIIAIIAIIMSR